jgi:aspartate carbamoyltransferase catalytic subunit
MFPEHFITTRDLSLTHARSLLDLAHSLKSLAKTNQTIPPVLAGKTVLQLFIENSTRTKMSFELAVKKLGGNSMNFAVQASSLNKGESLFDTLDTLKQYGFDLVVMRHPSSGAAVRLAQHIQKPIVNAGDGSHEHPTQALLDAMTLEEHFGAGKVKNKRIMIIGDILNSRVARSNIHLLSTLGAQVVLCAPKTLLPHDLSLFPKVEVTYRPEEKMGTVDAVMALRIQFERQGQRDNGMSIPSKEEYRHFWGLTEKRVSLLQKNALILHPGPQNRGLEIDSEVMLDPRCKIQQQVENGIYARMAALSHLSAKQGGPS